MTNPMHSSSLGPPEASRRPHSAAIATLAVVDFVIMLLPPLHWAFDSGNPVTSLGYFLGSGLFVTSSLVVMWKLDRRSGEQE
ncbi:hypothetical protein RQCS_58180 (plasmid) [Rhodococcus qingshengii]|uniref:hypothetical protein n=1 Tax=Rhodococcus qingshengii TaxID=334542 RepID=UPI000B032C76|nr:hypothetical protein [Rhodococcus qingshengii]BCF86273.1 hypothetical protein RQCS_58180 [Rhodococcus qingshengii]